MVSDSPASIIFDEFGNAVGVTFDGQVYRFQTETTLTDGYRQLGTTTNPIRIDPIGQTPQPIFGGVVAQGALPSGMMAQGNPLLLGAIDGARIRTLRSTEGGYLIVKELVASSAVVTNLPSTNSNTTIVMPNDNRLGLIIFNDSAAVLYIKLGVGASTLSYTYQIAAYGSYNIPFNYTGNIDGFWASIDGGALITELM